LSGLKSELLCDFHCNSKSLLLFVGGFPGSKFLEFPYKRFLVTSAKETLINELNIQGNEISEGVHSFGWAGQEEERLWEMRIVVGEYQCVVGFLSCE
jgi:hypothetical protein